MVQSGTLKKRVRLFHWWTWGEKALAGLVGPVVEAVGPDARARVEAAVVLIEHQADPVDPEPAADRLVSPPGWLGSPPAE